MTDWTRSALIRRPQTLRTGQTAEFGLTVILPPSRLFSRPCIVIKEPDRMPLRRGWPGVYASGRW